MNPPEFYLFLFEEQKDKSTFSSPTFDRRRRKLWNFWDLLE